MRILIAEDEPELAAALEAMLKREHYSVDVVHDGDNALDYGLAENYDGLVLDIMMPRRDGLEVLRLLREKGVSTPVLLLTARSGVDDRIRGLNAGADDYLPKPFDMGELVARVRALTRRQGEVLSDVLTVNDLSLDCTSRLLSAGERSVRLGFKEFEVLRLLMVNNGNVVTKETLISKIWGLDSEAEDNNVEVYISFLRKKLVFLNSQVSISTVRKVGYFLDTPQK